MKSGRKTKIELIAELESVRRKVKKLETLLKKRKHTQQDITKRKLVEEEIKNLTKFPSENPFPILRLNQDGIILYANAASQALLQDWGSTVGDYSPKFWCDLSTEVLTSQKRRTIIVGCGQLFYSFIVVPISGSGYVNLYGEEITERKQAEEALRESEERYRSLFENMLEGFAYYRMIFAEGRPQDLLYLDVNKAFKQLTGLEDVVGRKITEVIPGIKESNPKLLEIYGRVALTGKSERFEDYFEPLKAWLFISVYSPAKGYCVAIFNNITERKQAEEALRVSLEKYRVLFESFPLGITITDKSGKIIEANRQSEHLLGIIREVQTQRKIDSKEWRIIQKDCTPLPTDEYASTKALRENRLIENVEMGIVKDKGEITWISVTAAPIPLEDYGVAITYGDITERKRAEDEVRKAKNQLEQLNKHLIEAREDERARISREIHDELGQSLTAIKIDLNLIRDNIDKESVVMQKLDTILDIVSNTIKDVQRIASDLRPSILDDLGLVPAVEWYSEEFEKRTGILCEKSLEDIQNQNSQLNLTLFRIIQEALTNVVRHAHATNVEIRLYQMKKNLILEVIDNGIGIDENKINSNKSLGIIGMRERVRQFNGRVEITSFHQQGTEVNVFVELERET